jgi:hypothetical protein
MSATLALVLADANSHTAAAPDEGIALPIIIGIVVVVLAGGWAAWRIFSNRSRNAAGQNLADPPGNEDGGRFHPGSPPLESIGSRDREPRDPEREQAGKPL